MKSGVLGAEGHFVTSPEIRNKYQNGLKIIIICIVGHTSASSAYS